MYAYHVITDRPLQIGQQIIFDEEHHNGVYQRVYAKKQIVEDIYANPGQYNAENLEYPVLVALRELALEEVRVKKHPEYPSRMSCLYVSGTQKEAEGKCFVGDATKCFDGQTDKEENIRLAELYWENKSNDSEERSICEMLVDGCITIVEFVKVINANV